MILVPLRTRSSQPPLLQGVCELRVRGTSVPVPKFVSPRGTFSYELRNQRNTSNSMILVPLRTRSSQPPLLQGVCELRVRGTSVPVPKFVSPRGTFSYELRNQRNTSNSMILVPLRTRSSQPPLLQGVCELRVRGTSRSFPASGRDR